MPESPSDPLKNSIFLKSIPPTPVLLIVMLSIGFAAGLAAIAIMGSAIAYPLQSAILIGVITGTLVLVVPSLFTAIIFKVAKRHVQLKHILFITLVGMGSYAVFLLLGNAIYALFHNYAISSVIILVGDASIFGWWFFITKILLGEQKGGLTLSLVQPTLNVLIYVPYSKFMFMFSAPLRVLLFKLYAAMFIFLVMSYMILYIFNRPFRKNMGMQAIDTMSQFVQNWLFNIDVNPPFGISSIGINTQVGTDTFVFSTGSGVKAVLFIPEIHYGPMGTIGGSNFPYLLERRASSLYKAPVFVMHTAVNIDNNPVSQSQLSLLASALSSGVEKCMALRGNGKAAFYSSSYGHSKVSVISFNGSAIAILTRAPRVTEDIDPSVAKLLKSRLERDFGTVALVDAHNSRYESASEKELSGVPMGSEAASEYQKAIDLISKPLHRSRSLKIGSASIDIFDAMGRPKDLANGNLNVIVFGFNGFKYALLQFNANNMQPKLRREIVTHIKNKFGMDAEACTTDTHAVNTLDLGASNVLGVYSSHRGILQNVDRAIKKALSSMESVRVAHEAHAIKNFKVWGPNARERISAILSSVYEIAKVLVPLVIAGAFIVASLVILVV
ncbi:MAG: DUF2070 family protein [Candidatus Marsarchaeota archaeon]|jgi:putative membrane protein|nr:DUF2070 family protein [Candidatus Marsarchaeota archaeon]MCL5418989.1 DUF2070 family protein [Candidatus Marsarchaeota archaeon]